MRDRHAIYAAVKSAELKQQWGWAVTWAAIGGVAIWLLFPDRAPLGLTCLLVSSALGAALAYALPPRRRENLSEEPMMWTISVAILLALSIVVALTGPFALAVASTGYAAFCFTFTVNVARYQRVHGVSDSQLQPRHHNPAKNHPTAS